MMPCSSIRSRANAFAADTRFKRAERCSRARSASPSSERIIGDGDLWVTELVLFYDGVPSYTVSIMEFSEGKVARETQYFAAPFEPGPSRAHLVEPKD
jgi:hypothetical protein